MKIRKNTVVELAVTEWDDGVVWLVVSKRTTGQPSRDVFTTRRKEHPIDQDYEMALGRLEGAARVVLKAAAAKQALLF